MTALDRAKFLARAKPNLWRAILAAREKNIPPKFTVHARKPGKRGGLDPKTK